MAKKKAVSLTEGNIRKLIFSFSWPVFVSMIFSELYNVTNSMIVGNYVSLQALSAVSACTWICNVFGHTFFGIGMGAGILVANYYGAKDHDNLKKALDSSLVLGLAGGALFTVIFELGLPLLLKMINIGPDIYADAYAYMRVYILGSIPMLMSQICFFTLRSFGDTRHQLYYSIISSFVNIALGLLFVRVMGLNVVGTALATLISQIVMDVLALRLMLNYEGVDFDIRHIDFSWRVIGEICTLGIPAGIQNMLIALSSMMVQGFVNRFPNEVIAGVGVGEKVVGWCQLVSVAVSSATMSLVAQNMGAGRNDRAKEAIRESAIISSIGTIFIIAVIYIAAPHIVSRFNESQEVLLYGTSMVHYAIFGMFFVNLSHIYNGACRGAGNVKVPMMIAIFGQVFCKYMFVWIGTKIWYDVHVLYLTTAFGYTVAGILAITYFYNSKWSKGNGLR